MSKLVGLGILAALALASASAGAADCNLPPKPTVPDGSAASGDEMKSANDSVKKYMADTEDYLKCLDFNKGSGDVVRLHNVAVDQMTELAANYNKQVKAFKARQPN